MLIGWFTRFLVVAVVVVVGGYDTVTLAASHWSAKDDANNAAGNAATYLKMNPRSTPADALQIADQSLSHGETIAPKDFVVNRDGSVTLTMHRTAERTLVAQHLSFLKKDISFTETVTGTPASD